MEQRWDDGILKGGSWSVAHRLLFSLHRLIQRTVEMVLEPRSGSLSLQYRHEHLRRDKTCAFKIQIQRVHGTVECTDLLMVRNEELV
jgi:hypothetical protein